MHFSSVNEIQVIKDKSLLFEGQYVSKTFELNFFFYYLISGASNNYLTYLSDKKVSTKKAIPQVVLSVDEDRESIDNPIIGIISKTKEEVVYLEEEYNKINEITYNEEFDYVSRRRRNRRK